ncbi:hypothetical protein BI317_16730 [Xanthomonas hortorum pv. gardneri]|uniref:tetratricopeptide repeat protein n=1 Tax=Xanthomonas hortorum TaxID=56454 RepID=UPI00093873DB|nr:hypothetical protein [Xanthomonas hortorum]APP85573.1 hypothetical protein BI317_16730 [Xanthomonas hortorum pv. gardneri]
MKSGQDLLGIPGRDAVASKTGYLYQDYATALAWLRLKPNELLRIETAEDFAKQTESGATLTQVKRVKSSLTLVVALPFLDDVLHHISRNPSKILSFVYLTTASIAKEKGRIFRSGESGIDLWNAVKKGQSANELIAGLRKVAKKDSLLADFLLKSSPAEVVAQLVEKVTWAVDAPTPQQLRYEVQEAFSERVRNEIGLVHQEARQQFSAFIDHVTSVSVRTTPDERTLSHKDLNSLIEDIFLVKLQRDEHMLLRRQAAVVESLDPEQFNKEILRRTQQLRKTRFFQEADPQNQAMRLLEDTRDGGALQAGSAEVRATAMNWCARVLMELVPDKAEEAIEEAGALAEVALTPLLRALLLAKTDLPAARSSTRLLHGPESMTIRYAVERKRSTEAALDWVIESALSPVAFDQDGQFVVLNDAMLEKRWEFVEKWVNRLPVLTDECPVLWWSVAFSLVALAATKESREEVLNGVPVLGQVILRDTEIDFERRSHATKYFRQISQWACINGLPERSITTLKYALWLEISDPDRRVAAAAEIEERRIAEPNSFQWIALALEAGLKFDLAEQIAKIERRLSTYGSLTADSAEALLVLLMATEPSGWSDRLKKFTDALSEHIRPEPLAEFGMRALYAIGSEAEARSWVEHSPLTEEVRQDLLRWLEAKIAGNEVPALELRVASDPTPATRRQLITALARRGQTAKALLVARELYAESQSHTDAEVLVRLLMRREEWLEVVQILDANALAKAPDTLLGALRIAQFNLGQWSAALKTAESQVLDPSELQEFRKQVALYSGQWDRLGVLLEQAQHDPSASPEALLQCAHIAQVLDKARLSKLLTRRALAMPGVDAQRLFSGYMLAVKGNWQDEPEVVQWLAEVMANASDDGPVRKGNLRDLIDAAPAWHEKLDLISRETATGKLFQSLAAQAVNQPLSGLCTAVAHRNRNQEDPGHYHAIPAFAAVIRSGAAIEPKRIALDATTLLTLADLDMLEPVVSGFDAIALSHATGAWLFEERERTPHHQPSQVTDAKKRVSKFSRGDLKVLTRAPEFSRELAADVGNEISRLISSAEVSGLIQWSVIQTAPVHAPNSLGEMVADVSACANQLCSLHNVVRSLHANGTITETAMRNAQRFLETVDQGWPDEDLVAPGHALVLTDLALNYLENIGLVDACVRSGYTLWVDRDVRDEAHAYESGEDVSQIVLARLDRIREFVELSSHESKIFALPRSVHPRKRSSHADDANGELDEEIDEERTDPHPGFAGGSAQLLQELMGNLAPVEAFIIDDRAANRHDRLTDANGCQVLTASTLDILDLLRNRGVITSDEWLHARSDLRQAGYVFIPFAREELIEALRTCSVEEGILRESRYARAIRENHTLAQYSGLLQQPLETPWLAANNAVLREVIVEIWSGEEKQEVAAAQSDWLVELSRLDGFGSTLLGVVDQARWDHLDAMHIWQFALPLTLPTHRKSCYANWLEKNYVTDLHAQRPAVFEILLAVVKQQLVSIPEHLASREADIPERHLPSIKTWMFTQLVNELPFSLRDEIMSDTGLLNEVFVQRDPRVTLSLDGEPSLDAQILYDLAAKCLDDKAGQKIADSAGREWLLEASGTMEVWATEKDGKRNFQIHHAALFSNDHALRESYVQQLYAKHQLSPNEVSAKAVAEPNLDTVHAMERDLEETPYSFSQRLAYGFEKGPVTGADLLPTSAEYFKRLVGKYSLSSLKEFRATVVDDSALEGLIGLEQALLRSSHSTLVPMASIKGAGASELKSWLNEHTVGLDLWSLVGLMEGLLQREDLLGAFMDEALCVVRRLIELLDPESERLALQAALVAHVDGRLNTGQRFANEPPFLRRMVSIAHAALIERVLVRANVPLPKFARWVKQAWPQFQAAALCDLLAEPRWDGYMLQPAQLAQELVGRVINAVNAHRTQLEETPLGRVIFATDENSLIALREITYAALPGPLEGGIESAVILPGSMVGETHAILEGAEQPAVERLLIAAHTARLWRAPISLVDMIVTVLRKFDATPVDIPEIQMQQLVMTLAMAAAGNRHVGLAIAVQDFLIHRPHLRMALRLQAALTACGAYSEEDEWTAAIVLVVRRMIARGIDRDEANHVLFVLRTMCEVKWALRAPLAMSMARLEASSKRN